MYDREKLRAMMIENAAEINRLQRRVHEIVRSKDNELRKEWPQACKDFFSRMEEFFVPGGSYQGYFERILAGDPATIEFALCFLEVRPYFFRSGYLWKDILRKCKRAPMSKEQSERFAVFLDKYTEWKKLRNLSSKRGAAVRRDLLPLLLRFHNLFPVQLSDAKFDGLATVGDLYAILCTALKVEPLRQPKCQEGVVRKPCQARPQADMTVWAREYGAWRESEWTPEDIWATLVATIAQVYKTDASFVIGPTTILRQPGEG
jgi:hypothetical protein